MASASALQQACEMFGTYTDGTCRAMLWIFPHKPEVATGAGIFIHGAGQMIGPFLSPHTAAVRLLSYYASLNDEQKRDYPKNWGEGYSKEEWASCESPSPVALKSQEMCVHDHYTSACNEQCTCGHYCNEHVDDGADSNGPLKGHCRLCDCVSYED